MKKRVVVAMSGGVDSSVAAALLKEQGYEVIGMTMCFNLADGVGKRPSCCGLQGIEDARRVAHALEIKHYVVNMQKYLEEKVIKDFCSEYARGRTPNPCIRCNQYLKFDALLKKALSLDAQFLATGHYAQIKMSTRAPEHQSASFELRKARDLTKDQSYFLYRVSQKQLKHLLFPLGEYNKDEVRVMARNFGLPVAEKLDSQEICFLPDDDYRGFLKARMGSKIKPGPVTDKAGKVLGEHRGIAFYTIGQREGLGIAMGYPAYVSDIDPKKNRIILGPKEDVLKKECLAGELYFTHQPIKKKVALKVKIRYNHKESAALISPIGKKLKVVFARKQFAVTCGQSAVFYQRDKVVGGGIIESVK